MVCVADYAAFRRLVADLRTERGLHKAYEFHYAHIPETERTAFFEALHKASFQAWVLVVDKRRLSPGFQRRNQYDLFGEFIAALADRLPAEAVENALVVIDAHATTTKLTRSIRVAISRALRAREIQAGIKKVRGRPAHGEACPEPSRRDGLQLADMLAGAVVESKGKGGINHLAGLQDRVRVIWFEESEAEK